MAAKRRAREERERYRGDPQPQVGCDLEQPRQAASRPVLLSDDRNRDQCRGAPARLMCPACQTVLDECRRPWTGRRRNFRSPAPAPGQHRARRSADAVPVPTGQLIRHFTIETQLLGVAASSRCRQQLKSGRAHQRADRCRCRPMQKFPKHGLRLATSNGKAVAASPNPVSGRRRWQWI